MSEENKNGKNDSIGAIWVRETPSGKRIFGSIELEGKVLRFVAKDNTYKTAEKHPNYKLYVDDYLEKKKETPKENVSL